MRRSTSWCLVLAAAATLPAGAADGEPIVYGSIPSRVAVRVSVQMFDDQPDMQLDHAALRRVEVAGGAALEVELENGARYLLPVAPGRARELADRVRRSVGEVVHLEYHPRERTTPRRIHASWTLSPLPDLAGEGFVPLDLGLYRTILRLAPTELPRKGVFEPIVRARERLDALLDHVSNEDGRRTDELADAFVEAVREAGLHLGYFKTHGGEPVSEEFVEALRKRGIVRSAEQYWAAAVRRYRQGRPVNPLLDRFEAEWQRCPSGARVEGEFPGRGNQAITEILLTELRHLAVQGTLDRAELAAEARDVSRTRSGIEAFRLELAAANATAQRFTIGDFEIEGEPSSEERLEYLARKAEGETGFWGFFRALWRRAFEDDGQAEAT